MRFRPTTEVILVFLINKKQTPLLLATIKVSAPVDKLVLIQLPSRSLFIPEGLSLHDAMEYPTEYREGRTFFSQP
jgi:hypothetical protein